MPDSAKPRTLSVMTPAPGPDFGAEPAARPASPRTARLINDRVAYDLLLERGPLTRGRLRELTGLSGPTVSDLVQRLELAGIIAPVGETGSRRRGPNARLYGIVADRAHVAGVEVRQTAVYAEITDVTGRTVGSAEVSLDPVEEPDRLLHRTIEAALADAGLAAGALRVAVVGTLGVVDPGSREVTYVEDLPSWPADLLHRLRGRLAAPVMLENEVNLAGLAEHRLGAARGRDTFALLSLGEGIGVAIVLSGRLHRGSSGGAGELGYLPVGPDGAAFQQHAGGRAVVELAGRFGIAGTSPGEVVRAAVAAGPEGEAYVDALADRVAFGVAGLSAVLDPGFVVLAGAVGRAGGDVLAGRVAARVDRRAPVPTTVVRTAVEGNPVVRGAVLIALDRFRDVTFGRPSEAVESAQ